MRLLLILPLTLLLNERCWAKTNASPSWGLAMSYRQATVPYATPAGDPHVAELVPQLYYDNGSVYLDGLEAGWRFYRQANWDLALEGHYRFVDIPKGYQNQLQANHLDLGIGLRHQLSPDWSVRLSLLNDEQRAPYLPFALQWQQQDSDWRLGAQVGGRWKSADFNRRQYGLEQYAPGSGLAWQAGLDARYRLYQQLHLLGRVEFERLESDVRHLPTMARSYQSQAFVGLGVFSDGDHHARTTLQARPYIRGGLGWGTPSNLSEIFAGHAKSDPFGSQLVSLFYGHPVSDSLLGLPLATYLTPGIALHPSHAAQDVIAEYVLAMKVFYTLPLPVRSRLGVAEGLSYVSRVPAMERSEMERKGYQPSKLLNYLDFSLEINLGDLFAHPKLRHSWLGYAIHHRSGIFETSSAFGRIKGGSNYQMLTLQHHF